jgi:hypothetical protein
MEKTTAISFDESAYRQTANEVLQLVRKVAESGKRHDLVMKVNWLFYRSDVVALVKKLEERERDLGHVLTLIAAYVFDCPFGFDSCYETISWV